MKKYTCYMLFEVGGLFVQKNLHNNLGLTVARFNHGLLKTRPYMSHIRRPKIKRPVI